MRRMKMRRRMTLMVIETKSIGKHYIKNWDQDASSDSGKIIKGKEKGGVNTSNSNTSGNLGIDWVTMKDRVSTQVVLSDANTMSPREVPLEKGELKQGEKCEGEGLVVRKVIVPDMHGELKEGGGEPQLGRIDSQALKQQMGSLEAVHLTEDWVTDNKEPKPVMPRLEPSQDTIAGQGVVIFLTQLGWKNPRGFYRSCLPIQIRGWASSFQILKEDLTSLLLLDKSLLWV
jgi:hypothetical protein